ncbi:conserved hypothetical protein [Priestia megaterium]
MYICICKEKSSSTPRRGFFMSEILTQTKNSSAYVYIGEYIRKRKQYKKQKFSE